MLAREVQGTDQNLPGANGRRRNGSSSPPPGKGNTDTIVCHHRMLAEAGNVLVDPRDILVEAEPGDLQDEAGDILAKGMLAESGDILAEAEPGDMLAEAEHMLAEAQARWGHHVASLQQTTNSRASPAPLEGCSDSCQMRYTCIARQSSSLLLAHYIPD